jgi:uncharacterized protein (TIGR02996 family)
VTGNPRADTAIDALYAAVVAAPDDEAARRVLADRLLEAGDPQGEFIQLACDAEALPESDPLRTEITARLDELRSRHFLAFSRRLRAVKPFNGSSYAASFVFHRGFPDAILAHDAHVVDVLPDVAKVSPFRAFNLDQATPDAVRNLARLPELTRVRVLYLRAAEWRFEGALLDLFASPHLERLEVLWLAGDLTPADIEAMARCRALDRLSELHLLGDQEKTPVDAVLRSPLAASLHTLVLWSVSIDPETLVGLTGLRSLELCGARFGAEGAALFARKAPRLVSLKLLRCDVGKKKGLAALARSSALAGLETLMLFGMFAGKEVGPLLDAIELPELRTLALGGAVRTEGARALANAATKFAGLRALSLHSANIRDDGARALAGAHFPRLESLNLTLNGIGHEGMAALSGGPLLNTVRRLSLRNNKCGSKGGEALARAPALKNLLKLELLDNGMGVRGVRALLAATPNLEELDAGGNNYGAAPSQFIAASKDMRRLRVLKLFRCDDLGALARSPAAKSLARLVVSTESLDDEAARALTELSNLEELSVGTPSASEEALSLLRRRFGPILRAWPGRDEWDLYPGPP